jgi:hypothetical protein
MERFSQARLKAEKERTEDQARDLFVSKLLAAVKERFPTGVLEVEDHVGGGWTPVLAGQCLFGFEYRLWHGRAYRLRDVDLHVAIDVTIPLLIEELGLGLDLPKGPQEPYRKELWAGLERG